MIDCYFFLGGLRHRKLIFGVCKYDKITTSIFAELIYDLSEALYVARFVPTKQCSTLRRVRPLLMAAGPARSHSQLVLASIPLSVPTIS